LNDPGKGRAKRKHSISFTNNKALLKENHKIARTEKHLHNKRCTCFKDDSVTFMNGNGSTGIDLLTEQTLKTTNNR